MTKRWKVDDIELSCKAYISAQVYTYLRDNIFPDIQKFHKAIRVVSISYPTGVTDKEKVDMAVAVHFKETNKMEYKYRSYDPNKWKFYQSYLHL